MKTTITLKEFSALSPVAVQVTHATAPANADSQPQRMSKRARRFAVRQAKRVEKRVEKFREMLHRRYTTPFACVIPYHHWGINE